MYTVRGEAYIFGRLKVTYNHAALVLLSQEGEFTSREDLQGSSQTQGEVCLSVEDIVCIMSCDSLIPRRRAWARG